VSDYPHPIIAREGWPFLAGALAAAVAATWLAGAWPAPFWLAALFVLRFFRDPARDAPAGEELVLAQLPPG